MQVVAGEKSQVGVSSEKPWRIYLEGEEEVQTDAESFLRCIQGRWQEDED